MATIAKMLGFFCESCNIGKDGASITCVCEHMMKVMPILFGQDGEYYNALLGTNIGMHGMECRRCQDKTAARVALRPDGGVVCAVCKQQTAAKGRGMGCCAKCGIFTILNAWKSCLHGCQKVEIEDEAEEEEAEEEDEDEQFAGMMEITCMLEEEEEEAKIDAEIDAELYAAKMYENIRQETARVFGRRLER